VESGHVKYGDLSGDEGQFCIKNNFCCYFYRRCAVYLWVPYDLYVVRENDDVRRSNIYDSLLIHSRVSVSVRQGYNFP
jgi:hypothetical protein